MTLPVPTGRKARAVLLFTALFALPALCAFVVPCRSLGWYWPDYAFLFPLIGVFGTFFRKGLLSPPFAYEWVIVFVIYLFLLRSRRGIRAFTIGPALHLLGRVLAVFLCLRLLLVPEMAATVVLYRNFQASSVMVLVVALLAATFAAREPGKSGTAFRAALEAWRCRWPHSEPGKSGTAFRAAARAWRYPWPHSPWDGKSRTAARIALASLGLCQLVSLGVGIRQFGADPFQILAGSGLGFLWWFLFLRAPRRRGFRGLALATLAWYSLAMTLLVPDLLSGYLAFRHAMPEARWVTRAEPACYDMVPVEGGQSLLAAQGNLAKYFPGQDRPPVQGPDYVGGQRLALDPTARRVFMPAFMRYSPREEEFEDVYVYDFDLNLVRTLKLDECVGPLYVQYSARREHLYYSCEASGHLTDCDLRAGTCRRFGDSLGPNHIRLDETEDLLYVSPILEPTLDVHELEHLARVQSSPVVPPVYVSLPDSRGGLLYVARFVLGDLEVRDLRTLRVLRRVRLDMGPRDMDLDPEQGRLFTCNYFTGTLSVVDLRSGSVGRLFAGPRARGLHYDTETRRLFFCSTLGIGYYESEALRHPHVSRGGFPDAWEVLVSLARPGEAGRLLEFLLLFRTLT